MRDVLALIAMTALGVGALRSARTIRRSEGALLLAAYAGFLALLIAAH